MNKAGLKKVKRSTKTGTRSYWVRAQAIGRKEGLRQTKLESNGNRNPSMGQRILHRITGILPGKKQGQVLNSMHPWEPHHTEHVGGYGNPQNHGSAGPGSDHSWFALKVGNEVAYKRRLGEAELERYGHRSGSEGHAGTRREYGKIAVNQVHRTGFGMGPGLGPPGTFVRNMLRENKQQDLAGAFGVPPDHVQWSSRRGDD